MHQNAAESPLLLSKLMKGCAVEKLAPLRTNCKRSSILRSSLIECSHTLGWGKSVKRLLWSRCYWQRKYVAIHFANSHLCYFLLIFLKTKTAKARWATGGGDLNMFGCKKKCALASIDFRSALHMTKIREKLIEKLQR